MEWSNNDLRALAGIILLIIAIISIYLKYENNSINMILMGLVSFLVGGALFNKNNN